MHTSVKWTTVRLSTSSIETTEVCRINEDALQRSRLLRRFAQEHMIAAGFDDPASELDRLYRESLHADDKFDSEVKSFEIDYKTVMARAAYLRVIKEMAGDDAKKYRELYELGRTEAGRLENGGAAYEKALLLVPAFKPVTGEAYFDRFEDFPEHIHETVYKQSVEFAKKNL